MDSNSRNTLTERQVFYIAEFNEEAAWLSYMHREGWKMVSTTGFSYQFEACPEEDWTYQLDFKDDDVSEADYLQIYADYGWEFVTRYRRWYYFRKIHTPGDDMSIFSDNQSKIDMCRNVIRHHVMILTVYYLLVAAFFAFMLCGDSIARPGTFLDGFFGGAAVGAVCGGLVGIFFTGNQIHRLRRMIQRMSNPIE